MFIIVSSGNSISFDSGQIDQLWTEFVLKPNHEREREIFFDFLREEQKDERRYFSPQANSKKLIPVTSDSNCELLFTSYFLKKDKLPVEFFTETAYRAFSNYFIRYNTLKGKLKYDKSSITSIKENGDGLKEICHYGFAVKSQKVKENVAKFLCEYHRLLVRTKRMKYGNALESFTALLLEELKTDAVSKERFSFFLDLLMKFVS